MVTRLDDWTTRLAAYLAERQVMPFEWGVNDCMAFVAKGVEALTGHDFFTGFSDYTDEASAKIMLADNGGPFGIITDCLGWSSEEVLTGKRGDVVVFYYPDQVTGEMQLTGGLIDDTGERIATVTPQGLRRIPLTEAIRVWSY